MRKTYLFFYELLGIPLNFEQELLEKVLCKFFNHKTNTESSLKNHKNRIHYIP